jgi:hypothetical protein
MAGKSSIVRVGLWKIPVTVAQTVTIIANIDSADITELSTTVTDCVPLLLFLENPSRQIVLIRDSENKTVGLGSRTQTFRALQARRV